MRKKSYLSFKDLRVFYDKKNDSIRLTSGDPELAVTGWSLTLNRDSKDERILREALIEAGIAPSARDLIQEQERVRAEVQAAVKANPTGIQVGEVRDVSTATQLAAIDAISQLDLDPNAVKQDYDHLVDDLQQPTGKTGQGSPGPYIGYTTRAGMEPVLFSSLHGALGKTPAGVVVGAPDSDDNPSAGKVSIMTGAPGGGRSGGVFTMIDTHLQQHPHGALALIDPRGDYIPLVSAVASQTCLVDLSMVEHIGLLNPFNLANTSTMRTVLCMCVLRVLIDSVPDYDRYKADLYRIVAQVASQPGADMVEVLRQVALDHNYQLAAFGKAMRWRVENEPVWSLFFGQPQAQVSPISGSTVYSFGRLGGSPENVLQVMTVMCAYRAGRQLGLVSTHEGKLLIVEDAARLTSNNLGFDVLNELLRAQEHTPINVLLSNESPQGLKIELLNSRGWVQDYFAFRQRRVDEIESTLTALQLQHNDFNRSLVRNLQTGECLLRTAGQGAPLSMQFTPRPEALAAFNNNPMGYGGESYLVVKRNGYRTRYNEPVAAAQELHQLVQLLKMREKPSWMAVGASAQIHVTVVNWEALATKLPKNIAGEAVNREQFQELLTKLQLDGPKSLIELQLVNGPSTS